MARKRARNDKGHYIKDDPNTEVNEAWTDDEEIIEDEFIDDEEEEVIVEEVDPTRKAKQAKAPKNTNKSEFCFFVSANPEAGVWDFIIGDDRFSGFWDADRAYVHWKIPRSIKENAMKHHHVWSGRVFPADDE